MMFNYVTGVHTSATDAPTEAERRAAAIDHPPEVGAVVI
jgi:hypothetical protein